MKKNYLILAAALLLVACNRNKETSYSKKSKIVPSTTASQQHLCYVLCDFSKSIDSSGRDAVRTNALAIFKARLSEYRFRFYDMASAQFENTFFAYNPPVVRRAETPTEKTGREAQKRSMLDSLARVLQRLSDASEATNTCIIDALDKVAKVLSRDVPDTNAVVKIVVLSDMLEDCSGPFGNIHMSNENEVNKFAQLVKAKKPAYTFAGYKNLEIILVGCSGRQILFSDALDAFWKQLCLQYDITLTSPISASLPAWAHE